MWGVTAVTVGRCWRMFTAEDLTPGRGDRRYAAWTGLCLLVLLGLMTADLLLDQDSVAGTLAVPPVMASVLATRRQTAAVGVASLLGAALLSTVGEAALPAALLRVGAVLAAAALAVWAAGLRATREQRLAHLTRVAEVAQNAILLPVPSRTGPLALAARYRSATHDASVGGDLLDVVETPTGTVAIVGDVRGKGLAAVRLAATALPAARDAALTAPNLQAAVSRIEQRLACELGEEDFVSAVLARIDPSGRVELVNCAHPAPLLVQGQTVRPVEPADPTLPFGLGPDPTITRLQLRPGDRLFLYTDGLIETRAAGGRQLRRDRGRHARPGHPPGGTRARRRHAASAQRRRRAPRRRPRAAPHRVPAPARPSPPDAEHAATSEPDQVLSGLLPRRAAITPLGDVHTGGRRRAV